MLFFAVILRSQAYRNEQRFVLWFGFAGLVLSLALLAISVPVFLGRWMLWAFPGILFLFDTDTWQQRLPVLPFYLAINIVWYGFIGAIVWRIRKLIFR
jgi:hypothetical protein